MYMFCVWQYRKYKPLSVPRKCNGCGKKAVKAAYREICAECADKEGKCEGCASPWEVASKASGSGESKANVNNNS